jgi:multidrug resistance protein
MMESSVDKLQHQIIEKSLPAVTIDSSDDSSQECLQPQLDPWVRPRSWPLARKWAATLILSVIAFLQALAETILPPAEEQISRELHIKQPYQWMLLNSIVLIGLGLSSLILAPLSEVYGRKPVLLAGCISFTLWNTACGTSNTLPQIIVLRFFSGFGASVGDAVAGGVLSDLWRAESRGRAFALLMILPNFGCALVPICGAFISEGAHWRWVFWVTSITSVITIVVTFFLFPETSEEKIEQRLIRQYEAKISGEKQSNTKSLRSVIELIKPNLERPFGMLATQSIVQLLAVYMALLYGIFWLYLFIFPRLWREQYHQDVRTASLNYLSFGTGLVVGVTIAGHLSDRIYTYLKARNKGVGCPEFRIPPMVIGTLLAPSGLLLWGWSGEAKLHWIVPNIGSFIFAVGAYVSSACVSIYTIDLYTKYAASAISTNLVLRSVAAGLIPLFAPYMFKELGYGFGATVLAVGFGAIGITVMCVLWFFGKELRARSPIYASNADE